MSLGPNFYKKLSQMSSELGMNPEDILVVMTVESGIDPTATNPSGATGLVQFMPSTLKGLGFQGNTADFKRLTGEQQLDYVKKWIQNIIQINGGPLKSATQYYIGNFLPVALKLPGVKNQKRNTIIVAKNPRKPHLPGVSIKREKSYYDANTYLDYNKDGFITYGDIEDVLKNASKNKNFQYAISQVHQQKVAPMKTDSNIVNLLNEYLRNIAASNQKHYKNTFPKNNILIKINSNDYVNSVEFSRILCNALNTELFAKSFIHTDGEDVEIECNIHGPSKECYNAVKQLTSTISDVFKEVTLTKIGKINIDTSIIMDKKSFYKEIDLKTAENQYRMFLLKFV